MLLWGTDPQKEADCRRVWKPNQTTRKRAEQGQRLRDNIGDYLMMVLVGSCGSQEGGSALYEGATWGRVGYKGSKVKDPSGMSDWQ